MTIENLSVGGIQFQIEGEHDVRTGELLKVEFQLGDDPLMQKVIEVRRVDGPRIGAKLISLGDPLPSFGDESAAKPGEIGSTLYFFSSKNKRRD
jgi:hypothetical protein